MFMWMKTVNTPGATPTSTLFIKLVLFKVQVQLRTFFRGLMSTYSIQLVEPWKNCGKKL